MLFDEFLIKSHIRTVKDWPKPGINYRDFSPLLANSKAARMVTDAFVQRYLDSEVTHIGALDARGFLLGSNLAYALNKPLILFRKAGKLPGPVDSIDYRANYSSGALQIQKGCFKAGDKVVLVDDLLATGQTLSAASELVRLQGAQVLEAAVIIDLADQGGSARLTEADIPVYSLCIFDH